MDETGLEIVGVSHRPVLHVLVVVACVLRKHEKASWQKRQTGPTANHVWHYDSVTSCGVVSSWTSRSIVPRLSVTAFMRHVQLNRPYVLRQLSMSMREGKVSGRSGQ